jgi:hypothetical protein
LFVSLSSNRGVESDTIMAFERVLSELGISLKEKTKYSIKSKIQDDLFL